MRKFIRSIGFFLLTLFFLLDHANAASCSVSLANIAASANYLLLHNGPDEQGRAHPNKRLHITELEQSLNQAQAKGLDPAIKPYHARNVVGLWTQSNMDAVLVKKVGILLKSPKYNGDIARLIAETNLKQLTDNFQEVIGGRPYVISMGLISKSQNDSVYGLLLKYLEITGQKELHDALRPYHLKKAGQGVWDDEATINTVLQKKIESLLHSDKYKGDLAKFISETDSTEIFSPFTEQIAGHTFTVKVGSLLKELDGSPYIAIKRYLKITGQWQEWKDLKPYHLKKASHDTWNQETQDYILKKRIEALLKSDKYKGDIGKLIAETDSSELFDQPYIEIVAGHSFEISLGHIRNSFQASITLAIKRYLELIGQAVEWKDLKPYHPKTAQNNAWNQQTRDQVLAKKIGFLLKSDKYKGDLGALIAGTNKDELFGPLVEHVNGQSFEVSMAIVGHFLSDSPYLAIKRYLKLTGQEASWEALRPYHLQIAPRETWDQKTRDEVLRKKIDSLLRDKYDGSLGKLIEETTWQETLVTSLADVINGHTFSVSMASIKMDSLISAFQRYFTIKGQAENWKDLRLYHFYKSDKWDQETKDEVLRKQIDSLLRDKYNGNLTKLVAEINWIELVKTPLIDVVNGYTFTISPMILSRQRFYPMLKRYHQMIGREFPYSPAIFVGSPETRVRRMQGQLNQYDLRLMQVAEGKIDTSRFGFRQYSSTQKTVVRQLILEEATALLGDREVKYLGLETEQFGMLRLIGSYLNLDAKGSTVVESDPRVFNAMNSILASAKNGLLPSIGIEVLNGNIDDEVRHLRGPYNLVFLDYVGHLSKKKNATLNQLLMNPNLLEDKSLVFVTLANRTIDQVRSETAGFSRNQAQAIETIMQNSNQKRWNIVNLGTISYNGGTNGKETTPMFTIAFQVRSR